MTGRVRPLPYGFVFGPATVARLYADRRGVGLEVRTRREHLYIEISAAGVIEPWRGAKPMIVKRRR